MAEPQHPLLAPLTSEQQLAVDVVAAAFVAEDYQWPFYDHIERELGRHNLDAIEVLQSFPTLGAWNYSALAWQRNEAPEAEVGLTVVGMWHSAALRSYLPVFFGLVHFLIALRKERPTRRRAVVTLTVTSDEFREYWLSTRQSPQPLPPRLTLQLKEHEYPLRLGSGSYDESGNWSTAVTRWILPFEGVDSIEAYVATLDALVGRPPTIEPVLDSPLSLVASLDFLNAVWRLAHGGVRLFDFTSAERTTRLAWPVATADEFAAHLSAFADIFREADKRLQKGSRSQVHPLGRMKADLLGRVDKGAATRVSDAIQTLEAIITLRDAGQHADAGDRAIRAAEHLGVPYHPTNWSTAWQKISTEAINAINAVREELNAVA
jgi:hypothetical protein